VRQADSDIHFFKAATRAERVAIDAFLARHNVRGAGSRTGYVAYYAAAQPADGRSLLDRLVAALKICPLHTPAAARFFAGEEWRHVYVIQRLAACRAPDNLLSRFLSWCLKDIGRDEKVWYVAAYADSGTYNPLTGRPNSGAVYRASAGLYAGQTRGGDVEGYLYQGQRHSLRRGPRTLRLSDIPAGARLLRGGRKHRYCWAVGPPLARRFRRRKLERRMAAYRYVPVYQPRLLARAWTAIVTLVWKALLEA
jgi:hypothetical protein